MKKTKGQYSLISLFAGAGGLDLGLEKAGFNTIIANEIEPYACETLRKNKELANLNAEKTNLFVNEALTQACFKRLTESEKERFFNRVRKRPNKERYLQNSSVLEGDIRSISTSKFSEKLNSDDLFCIAGGPPCQPFSKAGKQKSLDCTKNGDLFYEFVRLVKGLKPKWFIFENVKGMTFTKTDVIYQICKTCHAKTIAPFHLRQNFSATTDTQKCLKCGEPETQWLVQTEAGGSQKIIFNEFEKLGYRCSFRVMNAADFGAPQTRERLFIVGSREGFDFHWPSPTHRKVAKSESQRDLFSNVDLLPRVTMYDALWPGTHSIYGSFDKNVAKLWVKNVVRPHDEPVTWDFDRPSPTIGAHQAAKLAFAPKGVPEKQLYRQKWATRGRKQGDTPPVKVEHEYLSDEELLTLQTFPNWWYLHGTRMQRAFQIGNAVPPILAEVIGKAVIRSEESHAS